MMTKEVKKVSMKWLIAMICLAVVFASAFTVLFIHGNYADRILARLGLKKQSETYTYQFDSKTVAGWDRCLSQLNIDADVVFFGDSIIHRSDFTSYFPEKCICNFGIGSDTLEGMNSRIEMIKNVNPEIVFVLGGINSLKDDNFDAAYSEYELLIDNMVNSINAEIYIISVLPISREHEKYGCSNETIRQFNDKIQELAVSKGLTYIDLFSRLVSDGAINPDYTVDGVHLTDKAYDIWADVISPYLN